MVINATCNNISVISWWSVLLVEETGVPGENFQPVTSHWQTLAHNVVLSKPRHEWESNSQLYWVIGTACTGSYKSRPHCHKDPSLDNWSWIHKQDFTQNGLHTITINERQHINIRSTILGQSLLIVHWLLAWRYLWKLREYNTRPIIAHSSLTTSLKISWR